MPTRKLRIVKKTPSMLGVCERCGSEFGSRLSGQDAEAEIEAAFEAHKCKPLDSSQNALRVVREAYPCEAARSWFKASKRSRTSASVSDEGQPYAANTASSNFRCASTSQLGRSL